MNGQTKQAITKLEVLLNHGKIHEGAHEIRILIKALMDSSDLVIQKPPAPQLYDAPVKTTVETVPLTSEPDITVTHISTGNPTLEQLTGVPEEG